MTPHILPIGRDADHCLSNVPLRIVYGSLIVCMGQHKSLCAAETSQRVAHCNTCRYNVLARSGDKVGDYIFGQLVDEHYKGIEKDGVPYVSNYTGAHRLDSLLLSSDHTPAHWHVLAASLESFRAHGVT